MVQKKYKSVGGLAAKVHMLILAVAALSPLISGAAFNLRMNSYDRTALDGTRHARRVDGPFSSTEFVQTSRGYTEVTQHGAWPFYDSPRKLVDENGDGLVDRIHFADSQDVNGYSVIGIVHRGEHSAVDALFNAADQEYRAQRARFETQ